MRTELSSIETIDSLSGKNRAPHGPMGAQDDEGKVVFSSIEGNHQENLAKLLRRSRFVLLNEFECQGITSNQFKARMDLREADVSLKRAGSELLSPTWDLIATANHNFAGVVDKAMTRRVINLHITTTEMLPQSDRDKIFTHELPSLLAWLISAAVASKGTLPELPETLQRTQESINATVDTLGNFIDHHLTLRAPGTPINTGVESGELCSIAKAYTHINGLTPKRLSQELRLKLNVTAQMSGGRRYYPVTISAEAQTAYETKGSGAFGSSPF